MADWLLYSLLSLVTYGVVGLVQKLTTNRISADTALVCYSLGYLVLFPVFWSHAEMATVKPGGVGLGLLLGLSARSGEWFLFKSFQHGGPASIVVPLTYTYPLITLVLGVALLGERLSPVKWIGIAFAVTAAILMAIGTDRSGEQSKA
jgi:bacterial/archaeal transporter family protein